MHPDLKRKSSRDEWHFLPGTSMEGITFYSPGEARTYKQIANAIGKPGSSRAVANSCAANPYAPFVPCHRVIRSDGRVRGYSGRGGPEGKLRMLEEEGFKQSEINDENGQRCE